MGEYGDADWVATGRWVHEWGDEFGRPMDEWMNWKNRGGQVKGRGLLDRRCVDKHY